jgi:hypothetical protein
MTRLDRAARSIEEAIYVCNSYKPPENAQYAIRHAEEAARLIREEIEARQQPTEREREVTWRDVEDARQTVADSMSPEELRATNQLAIGIYPGQGAPRPERERKAVEALREVHRCEYHNDPSCPCLCHYNVSAVLKEIGEADAD